MSKIKHGLSNTVIYGRWEGIIQRCNNSNNPTYRFYGAKGIKVCDDWRHFMGFYQWAIENGFHKELEIDRINSNGNYCPENCRFVTKAINLKNQSHPSKRIGPDWGLTVTKSNTYHVQVFKNGKLNHVGCFKTKEQAREIRDSFVKGEYKIKGIRPDKGLYKKPWGYIVHVVKNKKCYHVGTYKVKSDAIKARDEFKKQLK